MCEYSAWKLQLCNGEAFSVFFSRYVEYFAEKQILCFDTEFVIYVMSYAADLCILLSYR